MKLLCKHAFWDNKPREDYELLSHYVVSYAGGLPLALEVLGCFLCDKDIKEWTSTLDKLKEIPKTDIVEKLKISYDGLEPLEKELFLDIACFFKGQYKKEFTMAVLDASGFHPVTGVKVLIQKALITISDGRFDMHDLVQEMGHDIVRGKHRNNPEKHSRVWKKEDFYKICAMDAMKELAMIEAIHFVRNWNDEIELLPPVVANMRNLRYFLLIGDIASPFATNFPPVELRCLILDGISQKQLWNGYKHLPTLKFMELGRLENLLMTPDFNGLPNLERFVLYKCPCLKKIHPSIGRLQNLVYLVIEECWSLKMIPPMAHLKKLETLSFFNCPKLFEVSVKKYLRNLFVSWWKREVTKDLINVQVEECRLEEPCLPHNNINHHAQTQLRCFPTCFRCLNLSFCKVGDNDIGSAVWELPNLEELDLAGNIFTRLNFSVVRLPRLKRLNVSNCKDLVQLSKLPSSIAFVEADNCSSLESFGDISNCKWLWKVSVSGENELGPHGGDILLHSMLQGDEHRFISVGLQHQMIPKGFVGKVYRGKTFKLHLPDDWYDDFCGFLICIVSERICTHINIVINQRYSPSNKLCQESNEALDPRDDETRKFVGYVSFSSLRHTTLMSNLSHNVISFSIHLMYYGESFDCETYVGVELVPRKSKLDEVQKTDCSEFWDKESEDGSTFTLIQHDSQSSVNIIWQPILYSIQVKSKKNKIKLLLNLAIIRMKKLMSISAQLRKLIFKVDVHNEIEKGEALRALDGISEIMSKSIDMENKKLTVIGYYPDVGEIIKKLRKHWQADLVSDDQV